MVLPLLLGDNESRNNGRYDIYSGYTETGIFIDYLVIEDFDAYPTVHRHTRTTRNMNTGSTIKETLGIRVDLADVRIDVSVIRSTLDFEIVPVGPGLL